MIARFKEIIDRIKQLLASQERVVVAVDGGTSSETEYWAEKITEVFDGNLFHTADFCTEELSAGGTYLDCERLYREVLTPVRKGIPFFFRPIGKCKMEAVSPARLSVVEGTFTLHQQLRNAYDLKIMLRVNPDQRQQFLDALEPETRLYYRAQRLPAEALYFRFTDWEKHCDFVVDAHDIKK